MARIFVKGTADGLGRAVAQTRLAEGHQVAEHVHCLDRQSSVK